MNETGGTTYPPSPKTDSTKIAAVSLGAVCDASRYSSCSSEYSEASASVIFKRNAYGNGATNTPEGNGPNPVRYTVLEVVNAIVPTVRPWKEPLNTITFCLPVATRAILTAFSTASAPELAKKNDSIEGGAMVRSSSMSRNNGL